MGRFKVGDRVVAVSQSHGWGSVSVGDVGTVEVVFDDGYTVNFPAHRDWSAKDKDLAPYEVSQFVPNLDKAFEVVDNCSIFCGDGKAVVKEILTALCSPVVTGMKEKPTYEIGEWVRFDFDGDNVGESIGIGYIIDKCDAQLTVAFPNREVGRGWELEGMYDKWISSHGLKYGWNIYPKNIIERL